jgi:hypothetical protein
VGERGGGVGPRWLRGPEEEVGRWVSGPSWASGDKRAGREKVRERGWEGFLLVFLTFSNSHFKLLKLNSFQNTPRFSKHF